ncbi:MAG TPA: HupE/UreJ family protein [Kofleriaceae bacterium]|nr:HupE/UreJ family protein [Kofleriaceae bacterium]
MKRAALAVALVATAAPVAWAHKPSDAHVQIAVAGAHVTGTLAVALRDLDGALDLDADGDGSITWSEALAAAPRIDAYARERLAIGDGSAPCRVAFGAGKLVDFSDGAYWAMPLAGECPAAPDRLVVTYALLFDIDAQHRGIVHVQAARSSRTIVVRDVRPIEVDVGGPSALALAGVAAARVWTSPAVLLLLACLVLPVAAARRREVAVVFGTFALASSALQLLSAAELVYLPQSYSTLGLAAALAIAAVANVLRVSTGRRDLAFELGLLHGLACSTWLEQAALAPHRLAPALSFALGLAAAEATFVAVVVASVLAVRRTLLVRVLARIGFA